MTVLSDAARQALWAYLDLLDRSTASRGGRYAAEGRVKAIEVSPDHLTATVKGSLSYESALTFADGRWSGECTCPVAFDCKHCAALAVAFLNPPGSRPPARLPPAAFPSSRPAKKSFRDTWTPVIAEKLGRPLTDHEGRALGQLSALFTAFKAHWQRLSVSSLLHFGFNVPAVAGKAAHEYVYDTWWLEHRPPADAWQLWQYLAVDLELAGETIPEVFRPMTETASLRARIEEQRLAAELARWKHLDRSNPSPPARLDPAVSGLRLRLDREGWHLEVQLAPGQPFKAPAKKWLRELDGIADVTSFSHLSPAEAWLGAILATEYFSSGFDAPQKGLGAMVEAAIQCPGAHPALILPDGSSWHVQPDPLVWQAAIDHRRPDRVAFALVTAAGDSAHDAVPIARIDESYFLWQNRVYRGPPPLPAHEAPLRLLQDAHSVRALRRLAVRLPDSFAAQFRTVTLHPRLECRLDGPRDTEANLFCVRLLASSDAPPCTQEHDPARWSWLDHAQPPPHRPGQPHLEFDRTTAEALVPHLAGFRLNWFLYYRAWTRPLTRNFPDEFIAWRASLPAGVELVVSPELAGLVGPPVHAHLAAAAEPVADAHDWFDIRLSLRVEDTTLTPEEIALLLKARGKWVRLPRLGFRRLEFAAAGETAAALERIGLHGAEVLASGREASHRLHALQLAPEAGAFVDDQLAGALRERAAALVATPAAHPAGLRATLRPYQAEGFQFLAFLSANGFGGILADDMGLGKTVQTLAWLLHLAARPRRAETPFRALVVAPKSVVHGWLAETARFAPGLAALPFSSALTGKPAATLQAELLVANYTQLRLHAGWFQDPEWDAVVLDEGQFIKNPSSQAAAVARGLTTRHRAVLTGTPIENRLADLWSLFAFAQPGLLGTQAGFRRQYPDDDPGALHRLRRRTRHFLLRRTKSQVATDLPPRTEDELRVELEPAQAKLYQAELKRARQQLLGIESDRALDKIRFNLLSSLLRLRQICCHPALIDPAHRDLPSAKLDALLERLEELRDEGHQVLVFSQFVEMLELIRERLAAAAIGHLILTGATENRAELVEQFQTDKTKTVFLLSLKAAGFGLNLTAASYAILYDPWWNPAVEAQAIDRTHRIGQTRPVIAYRLLAEGTVEEKIRALQKEKAALASAVVQEESLASVLDLDSLRRILA